MPEAEQGRQGPADAMGNAVAAVRAATGEISETGGRRHAGRGSDLTGHYACSRKSISKDRSPMAEKAAAARWR